MSASAEPGFDGACRHADMDQEMEPPPRQFPKSVYEK
jgi:hypothetical protein